MFDSKPPLTGRRIRWSETFAFGVVHIIADRTERGWAFFDRDGYELQWFPRAATPELIAKASAREERARAASGPKPSRESLLSIEGGN